MAGASKKSSIIGRQALAWIVLFFLVWTLGSSFLSAISNTNFGTNSSDEAKNPTSSNNQQPSVTIQKNKTSGDKQAPAYTIGKVQILQSGLNLRSEPKKADNVIKVLKKGANIPVIEKVGGWYQVWDNGDTGYISTSPTFVKVLEMRR